MTDRAYAKECATAARSLLLIAARAAEGDLETVRHNLTSALMATDDALDAIQASEAAEVAALEAMLRV